MRQRSGTAPIAALRQAGGAFWVRAAIVTVLTASAIALPTVLIRSRFFVRMTPVRWYDYVVWALSSPLIGLTVAARRLPGASTCSLERRGLFAAGLTFIAVGCPVCNKAVVALLGVAGALSYFGPLQPVLGIASIALLLVTLYRVLDWREPPRPAEPSSISFDPTSPDVAGIPPLY